MKQMTAVTYLILVAVIMACSSVHGVGGSLARKPAQWVVAKLTGKAAKEALEESAEMGIRQACQTLGDDAVKLAVKHGDDAVKVLTAFGDDAVGIIATHGDDGIRIMGSYGDDAVRLAARYGDDGVRVMARNADTLTPLVRQYGDDAVGVFAAHPGLGEKLYGMFGRETAGISAALTDSEIALLLRNTSREEAVRMAGEMATRTTSSLTKKEVLETIVRHSPKLAIAGGILVLAATSAHAIDQGADGIMEKVDAMSPAATVFGFGGLTAVVVGVVVLFWATIPALWRVYLQHRIIHNQVKNMSAHVTVNEQCDALAVVRRKP